jgi:TonB family protein
MSPLRRIALLLLATAPLACAAAEMPAWLHVGDPQPVADAQAAYYEFATRKLSPDLKPAWVLKFSRPSSAFSEPEGSLAGDWNFFARVGEQLPRSGWRLRMSADSSYRVDVEIFCVGEDCRRLIEELREMRAPRPETDARSLDAWRKVVAEEPCDPLKPVSMPPPLMPGEENQRGIEGDVEVKVYYNRCGDVRDAVVGKSSGNKNLDRGAIRGVLHWRVKPATAGRAGWSSHTIGFHEKRRPLISQVPLPLAAGSVQLLKR